MGEAEELAQGRRPTGDSLKPEASAFSISQQIIDEVLTSGGNELDSILRIAAYFKKDHDSIENAEFLETEYRRFGRNTGKGFVFGGNRVSVWFHEAGISIATGDTTLTAAATLVTWEQAAKRIRELLDMGRYMPQSELDKVDGNEFKRLADELWYTHQDRADGYTFPFLAEELFKGGFPDSTARIAELVAQPEQRQIILDGLREFAAAYVKDPELLRFRFSAGHLRAALNGLEDLEREPLAFTADESVSTARPYFITQDEIDRVLAGGSGVEHGHYRIYSYFLHEHTAKEKADFLKHEYGIGGGGRTGFDEWHDSKGIAYSRENNHMPYDKAILSWPKVANRIDELIAAGRYMSKAQLDYLPEYENRELARDVYFFYEAKPVDVPRPFPVSSHYYDAVKVIRPQLDQPERVTEILAQMETILDNTADFDRRYESMRQSFDNLTAYQNGTYSMFPPMKPTTQARTRPTAQTRPAQPKRQAAPAPAATPSAADPTAEYDLYLGTTVYIGTDEYGINSFGGDHVVLHDVNAPLFTRNMPRAEFDQKLRENRLNDGLIKTVDSVEGIVDSEKRDEQTPSPVESPRILYKKYLPKLVEEIRRSDIYNYLRDSETTAGEAEDEIENWLNENSDSYPGLTEALALPQFSEWLIEDILDRTYQDMTTDKRDGVTRGEADAPDWAKAPDSLEEQIGEALSLRGFTVSEELIATGIEEYRAGGGNGNAEDIADFIESGYLTEEPAQEPEPYTPEPGDRYEIQGRQFIVDSIDVDGGSVSLRDITFEGNTGFPIFRTESLEAIQMYDPVNPAPEQLAPAPPSESVPGMRSIVIDLSPRERDSEVASPREQPESELTPAWEKQKTRSQTQTFDPHPEIPMSERHNFVITDNALGHGGAKTKYRNNVGAIRTLQAVEAENRFATPEEQEIISRYVGWGSLADAFDEGKPAWANEYRELTSLLSREDYNSARATTLNAHYTSPTVIRAIYKAVENMGFTTGNILEPSCGIGNFFGLVPESMANSKLYGVELDSLTGRMARQLYQKNSIAIQGFESTNLPDSFFDLAIGNVPFGSYGVLDKRYERHKFHIHDYFFAKTLDKVRLGGVIAFVTPRYTLDKKNPTVRKYIAQRADLLGAIRLPMNAFMANAGTEVTADIIFLQKRDRITDIEPDWVHTGQLEVDGGKMTIAVNSYFLEHPDMILGTMSTETGVRMYGDENSASCLPFPGADLSKQLADAISNIHAEISDYERGEDEPEEDNSVPADPTVRNFSYTLVNGRIYYRQDSRMVPVELPVTTQNRVRGMVALRECVRKLIQYQTDDYPESDIRTEQARLNRLYDDFTRKYGLINTRGNSIAFSQDSAYCLLCSLEIIDENGELERKADMFTKRTIKPHTDITHVDTASEALAAAMAEKARVDLAYMSGKKLDFYYDQFRGWAEEFEDAGLEQRKMIICQLVREINVSKGYELDIVLDLNYEQFLSA